MDEIELTGSCSHKRKFKGASPDEPPRRREKETGFPSPARDHLENTLSLDEYLIRRPAATFFVRVKGDGMNTAGIYENDLLVIDRSIKPSGGDLVVVVLEGEYKIRRIVIENGKTYLSINEDKTEITDELEYTIWGVVTHAIHQYI